MPIELTLYFRRNEQFPIWENWLKNIVALPLTLENISIPAEPRARYEISMWCNKIAELEICHLTNYRLQILLSQNMAPGTEISAIDRIPPFAEDFCMKLNEEASKQDWGLDYTKIIEDGERPRIIDLEFWKGVEWALFWAYSQNERIRNVGSSATSLHLFRISSSIIFLLERSNFDDFPV